MFEFVPFFWGNFSSDYGVHPVHNAKVVSLGNAGAFSCRAWGAQDSLGHPRGNDGPGNMSFPIQIGMIFFQVDEWCFVWGVYLFFGIFCLGYFFHTQEGIYLI